jgi:hypothetical protein
MLRSIATTLSPLALAKTPIFQGLARPAVGSVDAAKLNFPAIIGPKVSGQVSGSLL